MSDKLLAFLIISIYFSPVIYQGIIVLREYKQGNKTPFKRFFKVFKICTLALVLFSLVFLTLNHTNYLNYEKPIPFKKIDKITFENFRGLEFFRKSLYGNESFAYVVTSIESKRSESEINIESYFHPSRSFVYNTHSNSEELLNHELYHFRITELYARLIREKLTEGNDFSNDNIDNIIDEFETQERAFQKEYDYNTFHSYVLKEQKKYEKRIDSLLYLLKDYKEPNISIHENK